MADNESDKSSTSSSTSSSSSKSRASPTRNTKRGAKRKVDPNQSILENKKMDSSLEKNETQIKDSTGQEKVIVTHQTDPTVMKLAAVVAQKDADIYGEVEKSRCDKSKGEKSKHRTKKKVDSESSDTSTSNSSDESCSSSSASSTSSSGSESVKEKDQQKQKQLRNKKETSIEQKVTSELNNEHGNEEQKETEQEIVGNLQQKNIEEEPAIVLPIENVTIPPEEAKSEKNSQESNSKENQEGVKKQIDPSTQDNDDIEVSKGIKKSNTTQKTPGAVKDVEYNRRLRRSLSLVAEKRKNHKNRNRSRSGSSNDSRRRRHRRSHSRSRSRNRRRSYSNDRSRRSVSLERRRAERRRRHEERERREADELSKKRRFYDKQSREDSRTLNQAATANGQDDKQNDNATVTDPKAKITERQRRTVDLLTSRTGGAYIPPAKLRLMQAEITDKSSAAYQRIAWEALKKSIHGYINKVNVDNIAIITRELLKENIVRGRGLLCRSIIQAQAASPTFTHVYAALVAIINSKFPNIGELLLKRLIIQFKRAFRRNDKPVCLSASRFIAHLVNQRVTHEILALEILTLLVETPTDDSVEVAIAFLRESGMKLTEVSAKGIGAIFEMLKNILHEGKLDKRVQYMIEVVFQVRKDGFKDHQSIMDSLELVEEDDQFTHLLMLDEATDPEDVLNAFKFDDKYETNEDKYKGLSKEILGSDASDSGASSSGSESDTDSDDASNSQADDENGEAKATVGDIIDNTETNLIALRRTIYLTINSSLDYEECAHKLMKMQLKPGQEIELCHMFLDCCAEQRTYEKFYGLLAQRFCSINKVYIEPFEEIFRDTYQTTHRLDTNRLRNVSKFFAHLLFTDAISWDVLECIKLNEEDTTSSSRIFIKILFQELAEYMGLGKLNSKLKDEVLKESLAGMFPKDNPRNTRFAINFFTSIGLGGLTDDLRHFLKNAPKSVPAINAELLANAPVTVDSSSSSTSSSSSSSSNESESSSGSESSSTSSSSSDTELSDIKEAEKERLKRRKKKHSKKGAETKSKSKKAKKQKQKQKKHRKRKEESTETSSSSGSQSDTESSSSSEEGKRSKKKTSKKNKNGKKSEKKVGKLREQEKSVNSGEARKEKYTEREEKGKDKDRNRKDYNRLRTERNERADLRRDGRDENAEREMGRERERAGRKRGYDRQDGSEEHYNDSKRERKAEYPKSKSSRNASKERG